MSKTVTVEQIAEQRSLGWPDFGPEDYCHRCGGRNISWWTTHEAWRAAMPNPWEWNGIICPQCFAELFETRYPMTSFSIEPDLRTQGGKRFLQGAPVGAGETGGDE